MVNGAPYTGWLTDTDGKRYFFDSNGIMQTGWVEDNGKRYFMDLDGIMPVSYTHLNLIHKCVDKEQYIRSEAQRTVGWWETVEGNYGTRLGASA